MKFLSFFSFFQLSYFSFKPNLEEGKVDILFLHIRKTSTYKG